MFAADLSTLTNMKRKSPDTSSEAAPITKSPSVNTASSLQERSISAILSTKYQVDASSLEKLTYDNLVQLVLALKEKNKKAEEELASVRRNRYVVDPPFVGDRDGDYDRMRAICSKWSVDVAKDRSDVVMQSDSINLRLPLLYSVKDRKHVLSGCPHGLFGQVPSDIVRKHIVDTGYNWQNPDFNMVHKAISSANLLYRLCCLFQGLSVDIEGQSKYKWVWAAYVKHKASGKVFGFSEWKGAVTYQMPTRELEDEWVDDWFELLDLLCSDHCPHPYDRLVAGSVA